MSRPVCLITGVGPGTGSALVRRFARDYDVAMLARNESRLAALAAEVPGARAFVCDVADEAVFTLTLETVRVQMGAPSVTVHNAVGGAFGHFLEIDPAVLQRNFQINTMALLQLGRAVAPAMIERGSGHIAIVASVAGYRGLPRSLAYGPTKAALINLTETLYLDLAPRGIGVYLINPGFVKTPLTDRNTFKMPALISADEAAQEIMAGFARGSFEIHFPRRFTLWLKLLRLLPYRWYFALVHKGTGL